MNLLEGKHYIKTTEAQTLTLIRFAEERGINVNGETSKHPIDTEYPCLIVEDGSITQSRQTYDSVVSFNEAKEFFSQFKKTVSFKLNDEYEAEINSFGVRVGCEHFNMKEMDKFVETFNKFKEKTK